MIISYNEFKKHLHNAFSPYYNVHFSKLKNVQNFVEPTPHISQYNDILVIETDISGLDYFLNMEKAYGTCINKHHGNVLSYIKTVENILEEQYSLEKQLNKDITDIQTAEEDYQEEIG